MGNLSSLTNLYLSNNQLSGTIPSELSDLLSLGLLSLSNNQLSGEIPSSLARLSSLTQLSLNNNQLRGEIPSSLGNLSSLKLLSLDDNQLSGSIPPSLANLSSLEQLTLNNNQLSNSIPERLKSLTKIRILTLASNHFSPDDMASFIGGHATHSNRWAGKSIPILTLSPQTPAHPDAKGDTLYFSVLEPHIDGLTYKRLNNLVFYTAEYQFRSRSSTVVSKQNSPRLYNPDEGSYRLKTTLTNTNYPLASRLVFIQDVTVERGKMKAGEPELDNNKPVDVAQCALFTDGRGPLCYQYFAFSERSPLSSWDFSQAVTGSWQGITVNESNRVTSVVLRNLNLRGSIALRIGDLFALTTLNLNGNQLSGMIPSELGNLSSLTHL